MAPNVGEYDRGEPHLFRLIESGGPGSGGGITSLTEYSDFNNVCSTFVVGYRSAGGPQLVPKWGTLSGECHDKAAPIVFSVTHENDRNNHNGSANFNPNIVAYMSDLNVANDLGRWVNAYFHLDASRPVLLMSLDTINYGQTNVTGWPLRFGHLFVGANDRSVIAKAEGDVVIEFEIRILKDIVQSDLYPSGYSGHRVLVGAQLLWDEESPRTNKAHYVEIDLAQSEGYAASYREPRRALCRDTVYDRCFYSENGRYAEGREVSFQVFLKNPAIPINVRGWTRVHLPLSRIYRTLSWVSPPKLWSDAKLGGVYIGVESAGAALEEIEIRNYRVYATR
jgi:hypothetical protein